MDDISFTNMDSWKGSGGGSKFGLTFKQIVLTHINRCVINGSVEWHGGYWQERTQQSWTERYYIQNSRDVYNNSVKMLRALLLAFFDKEMKQADKELSDEFDLKMKEYSDRKDNENDNEKVMSEWYSFKVGWHIRLFEQLIMLSKRLNFFEEEVAEEEL